MNPFLGSCTYRHWHTVRFPNCSATTEECNDENQSTQDDESNRDLCRSQLIEEFFEAAYMWEEYASQNNENYST